MTVEKLIELRNKATERLDWFLIWVSTQEIDDPAAASWMLYELDESWCDEDSFCDYFNNVKRASGCQICLLFTSKNCCDGLWGIMNDSQSWEEWIPHAWAVRHFIVKRVDTIIENIKLLEAEVN